MSLRGYVILLIINAIGESQCKRNTSMAQEYAGYGEKLSVGIEPKRRLKKGEMDATGEA